MKCEYCDSIIQNVPDNGICPNCGGPLETGQKQNRKKIAPKPPDSLIGMYHEGDEYLQLTEQAVQIKKKYISCRTNRVIPYHEIAAVYYSEGRTLRPGVLCIRSKEDRYTPPPNTMREEIEDSGAVGVHKSNNKKYYQIYLFLKQCADFVNANEQEE